MLIQRRTYRQSCYRRGYRQSVYEVCHKMKDGRHGTGGILALWKSRSSLLHRLVSHQLPSIFPLDMPLAQARSVVAPGTLSVQHACHPCCTSRPPSSRYSMARPRHRDDAPVCRPLPEHHAFATLSRCLSQVRLLPHLVPSP